MNFFSLILPCISYHFIRFDSIYIVNMMMIWLIELRLYSIRWFVIVLILAMEKKWNDFFLLFLHNQKKWKKNGINEHWFGVVQEKKTTIIFHNHSSIQKRMNEWMLWSMKWNHHIFEKRSIINWPSLRPSSCVCLCEYCKVE